MYTTHPFILLKEIQHLVPQYITRNVFFTQICMLKESMFNECFHDKAQNTGWVKLHYPNKIKLVEIQVYQI
jgi:hypothetical protein